jgi:hypothetical protein
MIAGNIARLTEANKKAQLDAKEWTISLSYIITDLLTLATVTSFKTFSGTTRGTPLYEFAGMAYFPLRIASTTSGVFTMLVATRDVMTQFADVSKNIKSKDQLEYAEFRLFANLIAIGALYMISRQGKWDEYMASNQKWIEVSARIKNPTEFMALQRNFADADVANNWITKAELFPGDETAAARVNKAMEGLPENQRNNASIEIAIGNQKIIDGQILHESAKTTITPKQVSRYAKDNNIYSAQPGYVKEEMEKYLIQMRKKDYVEKGGAGFIYDGKTILTEGNHRMNAAIIYGLETGNFKYTKGIITNGNFTDANPAAYGYKIYPLPTK